MNGLAQRIADAWKDDFASAATRCLQDDTLTADAIIKHVLSGALLPPQIDPHSGFGNPPVQLAVNDRFYVEALFWLDGTTTIHDHAFSGAFKVLQGSSLHSTYAYAPGKLTWLGSEKLTEGMVRPITAELIHSLFHLDRPSVTLVARTHYEDRPQHNYTRLGVKKRFNADTGSDIVRRRLRTFLGEHEEPGDEELRIAQLKALRSTVRDPGQRYFLALLMNLPSRQAILDHAGEAQVQKWIGENSSLDALFPEC